MTSRRDQQLQQLDITQRSLRHPGALQGEITISISTHVRLVMVVTQLPALTEPLINDILCTLTISSGQVLQLTPDHIAILPQGNHCGSWQLRAEEPLPLEGTQVEGPAFDELREDPATYTALQRQVCAYRHDFSPQAG